jgi:hypothetical protein
MTTVTAFQVLTVQPAKLENDQHCVFWRRRSTKQNPVKPENAFRGVVIPADLLRIPEAVRVRPFDALLQATIYQLANEKFQSMIEESPDLKSVEAEEIDIHAVMAFYKQKQDAAAIDGAKILEWLLSSETFGILTERQQLTWKTKLPKIAAPSYAGIFTQGEAAAIVARFTAGDADSDIGEFILTRCNAIISKVSQEDEF